jgi:hypothetical protein
VTNHLKENISIKNPSKENPLRKNLLKDPKGEKIADLKDSIAN